MGSIKHRPDPKMPRWWAPQSADRPYVTRMTEAEAIEHKRRLRAAVGGDYSVTWGYEPFHIPTLRITD